MRRLASVFMLSVIVALVSSSSVSAPADEYWISYSGDFSEKASGGPKYVMKIDSLGNVLAPPVKVVPGSLGPLFRTIRSGHTISLNGTRWINMWFPANNILPGGNHPVFRAVIEKSTLELVSLRQTPLGMSPFSEEINVTQKPKNNFIVLMVFNQAENQELFKGAALAENGAVTGSSWIVIPDASEVSATGLSADGKVFFYNVRVRKEILMLQRLGDRGRPVGQPIVSGSQLRPWDVTGPLPGGRRYVFYESNEFGPSRSPLFIQPVDAKTLNKLGERILVAESGAGWAIDPLGRFILYGANGLHFQALDATGRPSGRRKEIVDGTAINIDIVKD